MPSRGVFNSSWPECFESFPVSQVFFLKIAAATVFVTGLLGFLFNCALVYSLYHTIGIQHVNLRIFLANIGLGAMVISGSLVISSIETLIKWESDCLATLSWTSCVFTNLCKIASWSTIVVSNLAITVDRAIASKLLDKYRSSKKLVGILVVFASWAITVSLWVGLYYLSVERNLKPKYCGNSFLLEFLSGSITVFGAQVAVNFLLLMSYTCLMLISWRRQEHFPINQAKFKMQSRIHVQQEFEATKTVLITVQLLFVSSLLFDGAFVLFDHFKRRFGEFELFVYSFPIDVCLALFTIAHPLLCYRKTEGFLSNIRNIWEVCGHTPPAVAQLDYAELDGHGDINLADAIVEELDKQEMEELDELESNTFDDGVD